MRVGRQKEQGKHILYFPKMSFQLQQLASQELAELDQESLMIIQLLFKPMQSSGTHYILKQNLWLNCGLNEALSPLVCFEPSKSYFNLL